MILFLCIKNYKNPTFIVGFRYVCDKNKPKIVRNETHFKYSCKEATPV